MKRNVKEIHGTILATERDRSGDIIQVAVEDDNFQKFLILNSYLCKKLFRFVNERMIIYGEIVDEDIKGYPIISLSGFIREDDQFLR
jgi:hypothetical protein